MSNLFIFERFNVSGNSDEDGYSWSKEQAEFDGKWVKAQDAIDRDKVRDAEVAALKQRAEAAETAARRYNAIRNKTRGERTHAYDGHAQVFILPVIWPIDGANIMQGSVAGHFDNAVDAIDQSESR